MKVTLNLRNTSECIQELQMEPECELYELPVDGEITVILNYPTGDPEINLWSDGNGYQLWTKYGTTFRVIRDGKDVTDSY